jgi:mRNA interferase YafQ
MRKIEKSNKFKRDYRREKSGKFGKNLDTLLPEIVNLLAADIDLPKRVFDHALISKWKDCRDCHLKPDLILIYLKKGDDTLVLVRLGSHSELKL